MFDGQGIEVICCKLFHVRGKEKNRLVLDSKTSWSNLPYALMPACVGLFLLVFPWIGAVNLSMTAPIMVPFGIVWLVIAVCINGYHSELILDHETEEVIYRTSLVLHSWSNRAQKQNVERVVLSHQEGRYQFVLEVTEGENLSITTFDYWRSREWSTQVARFLDKPLVDTCRDDEAPGEGNSFNSILDQELRSVDFDKEAPGRIEYQDLGDGRASITIPKRRLFPSARPRLSLGVFAVVASVTVGVLQPATFVWALPLGLILGGWASFRPLAQMTHTEEIEISKNGLQVTITVFGRSQRYSFPSHEIKDISVIRSTDARFEAEEFDKHAVCVEGVSRHLQLGAHLPKIEHVEWLKNALLGTILGG